MREPPKISGGGCRDPVGAFPAIVNGKNRKQWAQPVRSGFEPRPTLRHMVHIAVGLERGRRPYIRVDSEPKRCNSRLNAGQREYGSGVCNAPSF